MFKKIVLFILFVNLFISIYSNVIFIVEIDVSNNVIQKTKKPNLPDEFYKEVISVAIQYDDVNNKCLLIIEVKDLISKNKIIDKYFKKLKVDDSNLYLKYKDVDKWINVISKETLLDIPR